MTSAAANNIITDKMMFELILIALKLRDEVFN